MLTRRHIRIKVLQALYGYTRSPEHDLVGSLKELKRSLDKIYELYLYELRIFVEFLRLAEDRIETNRNKFRPTAEDLKPNTKFAENRILRALAENMPLQRDWEEYKVHWGENRELLNRIFTAFRKSDAYGKYMESGEKSLVEDMQLLRIMYADFITTDEDLQQLYEDIYMHWADDLDAAQMFVTKTLTSFKEAGGQLYNRLSMPDEAAGELPDGLDLNLLKLTVNLFKDEDDRQFGPMLLRHTVNDAEVNQELIAARTRNWDTDRIAVIDILLMQMGISELVHFQEIPIKVTLNEYIDLSKEYSTPKSGQFINGILDKLVLQLVEDKRIVKIGRGLL